MVRYNERTLCAGKNFPILKAQAKSSRLGAGEES